MGRVILRTYVDVVIVILHSRMNVQFVNLRSSSVLRYTVDTVRSLFVGHFLWSFAAAADARHLAGISVTRWWHSVESGTDCSVTLDSET